MNHFLLSRLHYTYDWKIVYPMQYPNNYYEGYEQCDFHQYTGWGNWLRMNEQKLDHNPQKGGGGPL